MSHSFGLSFSKKYPFSILCYLMFTKGEFEI